MQQLGLFEQYRTTTGLVHRLGRAAEVEVNHRCAEGAGKGGVIRQAGGIGAKKLHAQRRTSSRLRVAEQFRSELLVSADGQYPLGDPDKLRHAPIDAAHLSEHIAKDFVDQPLHRGQGDLHRQSLENAVLRFS